MGIKPTLITGPMRSGTTWTGKMLLLSNSFFNIGEPLNMVREPLNSLELKYQYIYINKNNQDEYINKLTPILGMSYSLTDLVSLLKRTKSLKFILLKLWKYPRTNYHLSKNREPLVKDPLAFMSAEWLAKTYNMNVVMLIRHPAAYISSMKRMKWGFNFAFFSNQEKLMEDYLKEFEEPIRKYAKKEFVDFGIDTQVLVWNILHKLVLQFQKEHPEWFFYRHEDLSIEPQKYFEQLYSDLGLEYTDEVNNKILEFTLESNKKEAIKGKQFDFIRDSKAVTKLWKERLTSDEIKQIHDGTQEISSKFYDESFW